MFEKIKSLPNQLTALRLLLIPVLWVCAFRGLSLWVGIGLAFAILTDFLDGFFARKLHQISSFGAKFDSLADNLLQPSALVWLWILKQSIFLDHPIIWGIAIAIYFSSLIVGLVKFKRFGNLHLYSSKFAAAITVSFAIHTLIASQYSAVLLYLALISSIISSAETLILQLMFNQVNEHMGSLFLAINRKREERENKVYLTPSQPKVN